MSGSERKPTLEKIAAKIFRRARWRYLAQDSKLPQNRKWRSLPAWEELVPQEREIWEEVAAAALQEFWNNNGIKAFTGPEEMDALVSTGYQAAQQPGAAKEFQRNILRVLLRHLNQVLAKVM